MQCLQCSWRAWLGMPLPPVPCSPYGSLYRKNQRQEEKKRKEGRKEGGEDAHVWGVVGRVESGGKHSCLHMNAFPPKFFWAIFGVRIEKSCCGGAGMRSRIIIVMVSITTSRSLSSILSVSVCVCLCLLFGLFALAFMKEDDDDVSVNVRF